MPNAIRKSDGKSYTAVLPPKEVLRKMPIAAWCIPYYNQTIVLFLPREDHKEMMESDCYIVDDVEYEFCYMNVLNGIRKTVEMERLL